MDSRLRGNDDQPLLEPFQRTQSNVRSSDCSALPANLRTSSRSARSSACGCPPATFLLYFVTGTDELTPSSKDELAKVLAAVKDRPSPDVLVIGHTDRVGDDKDNDRLSAQRAERVKRYLVEIGIPAERIHTAGRGEREPLVPTADNVEEPRNRRVEINVR